jgi:hypothetical protein
MNKRDITFNPNIYSDDGYLLLIGWPILFFVIILYSVIRNGIETYGLWNLLGTILVVIALWIIEVKFYSFFALSTLKIEDGYIFFKNAFNRKYGIGNMDVHVEVMPKLKLSSIVEIQESDEYQILGSNFRKEPAMMHIRLIDRNGQYLDIPYRRFLKKDMEKLISLIKKENMDVVVDDPVNKILK